MKMDPRPVADRNPVDPLELFLYYFGFTFFFVVLYAYRITVGNFSRGWGGSGPGLCFCGLRAWPSCCSWGLVYNAPDSLWVPPLFMWVVTFGDPETSGKLFKGGLSKGLAGPLLYLAALFALSYGLVYWKLGLRGGLDSPPRYRSPGLRGPGVLRLQDMEGGRTRPATMRYLAIRGGDAFGLPEPLGVQ